MSLDNAPESTLPYPPVHQDKKFVVFSDWDGTITTYDSNDYLTDFLGYGKEKRRAGNLDILHGRIILRDNFREMLESVSQNGHTFEDCKRVLRDNIKLDSGFLEFFQYCKSQDIPFIIVSNGMEPLIRAILSTVVDDDDANRIEIISNSIDVQDDGSWSIKFRHPSSGYGHDKSHAILPYKDLENPPLLFFFGDGVSDISAAKHADMLFAKEKPDGENDLATYCTRENIPHVMFANFSSALPVVRSIVEGEKSPKDWFEIGRA
ncbi:HAD-like domain-containing protein [Lactifluus volemus]|nr:HAD-like domain-containing protein [Lactifluus volemus]